MIAPVASTTLAPAAPDPKRVKAAQAFEAVFLRQMIGSMRAAKLADGALSSGAGDQFRDMMDARTADTMAATQGLGIAKLLLSQWSKSP